jgi:hypothetical protein
LDLVNNNPTDIADGNARITLGLVWQLILHFQIEANAALLREWGWDVASTVSDTHSSMDSLSATGHR